MLFVSLIVDFDQHISFVACRVAVIVVFLLVSYIVVVDADAVVGVVIVGVVVVDVVGDVVVDVVVDGVAVVLVVTDVDNNSQQWTTTVNIGQ